MHSIPSSSCLKFFNARLFSPLSLLGKDSIPSVANLLLFYMLEETLQARGAVSAAVFLPLLFTPYASGVGKCHNKTLHDHFQPSALANHD